MKPCNEFEIVGIKSMDHSKDYYVGYDAAEKNYIRILDKIRSEIGRLDNLNPNYLSSGIYTVDKTRVLRIIDKYRKEGEDKE